MKFTWMNGVYIRRLALDDLTERTIPYLERQEAEGGLPDSIRRPLEREPLAHVPLVRERLSHRVAQKRALKRASGDL